MMLSVFLVKWDFALSLCVIGYVIVLIALTFLYIAYTLIPILLRFIGRQYRRRKGAIHEEIAVPITGEISAAITTAIYLYLNEQHDTESGKITIKEVSKKYSPWSSKIYGMRHTPNH
ncbi:MAG TPA: hypothetical protein DCG69_01000 [Bacteroidales bacterium]|nr:hypothetical protein [Bacteroidales bacterium]